MRMVPMVIEESAMLKTGHILKSIKSMTYDNRNLSMRLPMAPESIKIRLQSNTGLDKNWPFAIDLKIRPDIKTTATTEIALNTRVLFLKSPNAAPVFFTYVIWSTPFIKGMLSPILRLRLTSAFEHWSMARIKKMATKEISVCFSLLLICIVCRVLREVLLLTAWKESSFRNPGILRTYLLLCASRHRLCHK